MFIQEYHGIKPSISHHTHSLLLAHVLKLIIHGRHGSTEDLTHPTKNGQTKSHPVFNMFIALGTHCK